MTAADRPGSAWHHFGMRTPSELDALVTARLLGGPSATEPSYQDFLRDPEA